MNCFHYPSNSSSIYISDRGQFFYRLSFNFLSIYESLKRFQTILLLSPSFNSSHLYPFSTVSDNYICWTALWKGDELEASLEFFAKYSAHFVYLIFYPNSLD